MYRRNSHSNRKEDGFANLFNKIERKKPCNELQLSAQIVIIHDWFGYYLIPISGNFIKINDLELVVGSLPSDHH